jgi:hypothetical protein
MYLQGYLSRLNIQGGWSRELPELFDYEMREGGTEQGRVQMVGPFSSLALALRGDL